VDVLTATHVAAINAPRDQQPEEGASDVQHMQQIVCGLTFDNTLNNAHTGKRNGSEININPFIHPTTTSKCLRHLLPLFANSWHLIKAKQRWWAMVACEGVRTMLRLILHAKANPVASALMRPET